MSVPEAVSTSVEATANEPPASTSTADAPASINNDLTPIDEGMQSAESVDSTDLSTRFAEVAAADHDDAPTPTAERSRTPVQYDEPAVEQTPAGLST